MTSETHPRSLRVGRVLRVHGLEGAVRVEPLTDFADRFHKGARLEVNGRLLTVSSAKRAEGALIVRFEEVADRMAAQALRGAYLTVPLEDARALPADRFYHFQLVGLPVIEARTGRPIGAIAEVLEYPANDVLRVVEGAHEVLIPMVRGVVRSIDLAGRRVVVEMPEEV